MKDTLIARGIEKDKIDDYMVVLEDKEVRIKESAHLTIERSRPKTRLRQSSQRRGRKSRRSSSSPEDRSIRPKSSTPRCDLCDNEGHLIRDCPELRTAKRLLRESRSKITLVDRSKTKRNRSRVRDQSSVRFSKYKAYIADSESEGEDENNDSKSDDVYYASEGGHDIEERANIAFEPNPARNAIITSCPDTDDDTDDETTKAYCVNHQVPQSDETWIPDSGASSHMTDRRHLFRNEFKPENGQRHVKVGGGQLPIMGKGTVHTRFMSSSVRLRNVLYVPRLGANLLSIPKLTLSGLVAVIKSRTMEFYDGHPENVVIRAEKLSGRNLYTATWADNNEQAFMAREPEEVHSDIEQNASATAINPSDEFQKTVASRPEPRRSRFELELN